MGQIPPLASDLNFKAGHYVSPNNTYGLDGVIMYAGSSGIWTVEVLHEIHVTEDKIRVFYFNKPKDTIAEFSSADEFLAWCRTNGRINPRSEHQDWCD